MEHKRVKREFIERLVEEVSLSEVLRHHGVVTRKLNRESSTCLCPFHSEKTPSFIYNDTRKTYNCFGCKASGNLITLVRGLTGQESYVAVIQHLAQVAGLPMEYEESNYSDDDLVYYDYVDSLVNTDREVISKIADIYNKQLLQPSSAEAYEYLHYYRQLKPEIIQAYNLGYCPPASIIAPLLKQSTVGGGVFGMGAKNVLLSLVRTATMMPRTDAARLPDIEPEIKENQLPVHREQLAPLTDYYETYYDRITFPIYDEVGNITGFGARTLHDYRQKLGKRFKPDQAKYKNTSNRSSLYDKSKMIYGLYQVLEHHRKLSSNPLARPKIDRLILVEGYLDVISLAQYGIWQGVAASGTAMKAEQIRYLFKFCKNLVLCLDGDKAGRAAALKTAKIILGEYKTGYNVRILHLPGDHDPDSYLRAYSPDQFEELIEHKSKGLFEYIITSMLDEYGKEQLNEAQYLEVRGQLGELYASLDSEELNERSFFVEYCTQHLNQRAKFTVDPLQLESLFKNQEEQLAREKAQQQEKEQLDRYYLEIQGAKARFKNKLFLQQMQVREFEGLTIKETQVKHPRQQRDEARWGGYGKDFKGKSTYQGNKGQYYGGSSERFAMGNAQGGLNRGRNMTRAAPGSNGLVQGKSFTRYARGMKTTREQVQEEMLNPPTPPATSANSHIQLGTGVTLPDDLIVGSDLFASYEGGQGGATYHEDLQALHDYYQHAGVEASIANSILGQGEGTESHSPALQEFDGQGAIPSNITSNFNALTVQQLYAQGSLGTRGNFAMAGSAGNAPATLSSNLGNQAFGARMLQGSASVHEPSSVPTAPTVPQFSATSFNPQGGGTRTSASFGFGVGQVPPTPNPFAPTHSSITNSSQSLTSGASGITTPSSYNQSAQAVSPVQDGTPFISPVQGRVVVGKELSHEPELEITRLTAPDVSSQLNVAPTSATSATPQRSLLGSRSRLTSHLRAVEVDPQQLRSSNKTRGAKSTSSTYDGTSQILNRLKSSNMGGGVGLGGVTAHDPAGAVQSVQFASVPASSEWESPASALMHSEVGVEPVTPQAELSSKTGVSATSGLVIPEEMQVVTNNFAPGISEHPAQMFGAGGAVTSSGATADVGLAIPEEINAPANDNELVQQMLFGSGAAPLETAHSVVTTVESPHSVAAPEASPNTSNAVSQPYADLLHPAPPQFSSNDLFAPQYLQRNADVSGVESTVASVTPTASQHGAAVISGSSPQMSMGAGVNQQAPHAAVHAGGASEATGGSLLGNNLSADELNLLQEYGLGFDLQGLEEALQQAAVALEQVEAHVAVTREEGFGNRKLFLYHNLEITLERTPQTAQDYTKYLNALLHVELRIPRVLAAYLANHNLVGPQIIAPFKLKVFEFLKEFRVRATKIKHAANLDRKRDPVNLVRELVDKYQLGEIYDVEEKIYQVNLTEREIETTYKDLIQSLLKLLEACRSYVFKYMTQHAHVLNNVNVELEALNQYRLLWTHCLQGISLVKSDNNDAKDARQKERLRYAEEFLQAYQQQRMFMHTYLIDDVRKANPTPVVGFDVPAYGAMPELNGKELLFNEAEKQELEQQALAAQIAASKLAAQQEAISAPKRNAKALGSTLSKLTQDKPQVAQPVIPDRLKGLRKEINPQQVSLVASRLGAMAEGKVEVVQREQVDFSGSSSAFAGLSMTGMNFRSQAQGAVEFASAWGGKAFKDSSGTSSVPPPEVVQQDSEASVDFALKSSSTAEASSPWSSSSPFTAGAAAPSSPFGAHGSTTSSPFASLAQGGSPSFAVVGDTTARGEFSPQGRDTVAPELTAPAPQARAGAEQMFATSATVAESTDTATAGALDSVVAELEQVADSPDFRVAKEQEGDESLVQPNLSATTSLSDDLASLELQLKPTIVAYEDAPALLEQQEWAGKRAQYLEDEEERELAEQERAETAMYDAAAAAPPTKPKRGKLSPTAPSLEKLEEFASMPFMSAKMFASIQSDKLKESQPATADMSTDDEEE